MHVKINGEQRDFPDASLDLSELIAQLSLPQQRIAVEVNRQIVPRVDWEHTEINDGDTVEIVHFVGGGTSGVRRPQHAGTSRLIRDRCKFI